MLRFCLSNGDGGLGRKAFIFGWGGARRVRGFAVQGGLLPVALGGAF